jgi:hypothetical protein
MSLPPELWERVLQMCPLRQALQLRLLTGGRMIELPELVWKEAMFLVTMMNDLAGLLALHVPQPLQIAGCTQFEVAAAWGSLDICRHFYEQGLRDWHQFRAQETFPALMAAYFGHLHVLKWLHSTFQFTLQDLLANDVTVSILVSRLVQCCYWNVLYWIHATFQLRREDVIADRYEAWTVVLEGPAAEECLTWLTRTFRVTREELCDSHCQYNATLLDQHNAFNWQ